MTAFTVVAFHFESAIQNTLSLNSLFQEYIRSINLLNFEDVISVCDDAESTL